MKTKEQVLEAVKKNQESPGYDRNGCEMIDARDYSRLADFFDSDEWTAFGFSLKDDVEKPTPKDFTESEIIKQMKGDLNFAIEKAEDQRGISSGLMFGVMKMWLWILDDDLFESDSYDPYGLPLYRQIEEKYADQFELARP